MRKTFLLSIAVMATLGIACSFVNQALVLSGLARPEEAGHILSEDNPFARQEKQYLMIPDYTKETLSFYEIGTGELVSMVDTLRGEYYFYWTPESKSFVLERIWCFTGEARREVVAAIPYEDPDRNDKSFMQFPGFQYLNDQYIITGGWNFNNSGVYIIDLKDSSVHKLTILLGESENDHVSPVDCNDEMNQCVFHTNKRLYLMDVTRKEIIRDFHPEDVNYIHNTQIIPNNPYVFLEYSTKDTSSEYSDLHYVLFNLETGQVDRIVEGFDYQPHNNNEGRYLFFHYFSTYSSFHGEALIYDIQTGETIRNYRCPDIGQSYLLELDNAAISDDGQYVALGCVNGYGDYKSINDTGEVYVFQSDQPNQPLYKIENIGLAGSETGRYHTDVFFYKY